MQRDTFCSLQRRPRVGKGLLKGVKPLCIVHVEYN